ncbi:MAG UNVERIFIED_CONTAM: hypothetical protein LVR18_45520 [Planctomycetaceae bacterium]
MSIARHHTEWLSLVPVSGPFLSLPVLLEAFSAGLEPHDPDHVRLLRQESDGVAGGAGVTALVRSGPPSGMDPLCAVADTGSGRSGPAGRPRDRPDASGGGAGTRRAAAASFL